MTEEKKKKFKARSMKKMLKSENTIFPYGDGATWDIKSDSDPEKIYMVYRSEHEGWLCDCMWFAIHENPSAPHPACKHIKRVQSLKPFDKYESYSGLSQDEFKEFIKLREKEDATTDDLLTIIDCLEAIAEGRANRIKELEQELIDQRFELISERD